MLLYQKIRGGVEGAILSLSSRLFVEGGADAVHTRCVERSLCRPVHRPRAGHEKYQQQILQDYGRSHGHQGPDLEDPRSRTEHHSPWSARRSGDDRTDAGDGFNSTGGLQGQRRQTLRESCERGFQQGRSRLGNSRMVHSQEFRGSGYGQS